MPLPLEAEPRHAYKVDQFAPIEWDRIATRFDDWHLFQTSAYADPLRGRKRISDLLLYQHEQPIAGARALIIPFPGCTRGVAYVKHGPFWRQAGASPEPALYERAVAAVIDEYAEKRGHMLTIAPRPHPDVHPIEHATLKRLGFDQGSGPERAVKYYFVRTELGEPELRASLSQGWRHKLKRSESAGFKVELFDTQEALDRYVSLHKAMVARKQFNDRDPQSVLLPVIEQLPRECLKTFFCFRGDQLLAGAVVIVSGDTAFYLLGASVDAALEFNAGYALQWQIANWLRACKIKWYDLGDGFGGLRQFKEGFSGKAGAVIEATEFHYASTPLAKLTGQGVYRARSALAAMNSGRRLARKKLNQYLSI